MGFGIIIKLTFYIGGVLSFINFMEELEKCLTIGVAIKLGLCIF